MSTATAVRSYPGRAPRMWLLRDAPKEDRVREIDFHVESGDYFVTLSTILWLLEDSLSDCRARGEAPTAFQLATLQSLKDELLHMHRNYTIRKK